jgi:hypothetical protein
MSAALLEHNLLGRYTQEQELEEGSTLLSLLPQS